MYISQVYTNYGYNSKQDNKRLQVLVVESRRVYGKPRPIALAYLGKAEDLLKRLLYKWLNRRGGKPAWKWNKFSRLISEWHPLAKPRVFHSYLLAKP